MTEKTEERLIAEQKYVTGSMTLRELAKELGVSKNVLGTWSKKDNWVEKRKQFNQRALKKAVTKATNKKASELAVLMEANDTMERALRLAAIAFEQRLLAEAESGAFANDKFAARNLESVAEAVGKSVQTKMLLCGIMEEKDKRKLDLEERKLNAQDTDGTEITVTLLAAEELSE